MISGRRQDLAFPFRIDGVSRQARQVPYEDHVRQMIRQTLLTSPGERVNLPEFGCGLRQLIFAPNNEALQATVKLTVLQALDRWLGGHIKVKEVKVLSEPDLGSIRIDIEYQLRETLLSERLELRVP